MSPLDTDSLSLEEAVDLALRMTDERIRTRANFPILNSIKGQLEFIRETVKSGRRPTPEEKARLTLGLYATREFEDTEPDYADVLHTVSYGFDNL